MPFDPSTAREVVANQFDPTTAKEVDVAGPSAFEKYVKEPIYGPAEALATMGTGLAAGAVAPVYGVGKSIAAGKYGTQAGVRMAEEEAAKAQQAMTYQPRTAVGKGIVGGASQAARALGIDMAPLMGLAPELSALRTPPGAMTAATAPVRQAARAATEPVRKAAGAVEKVVAPKAEPIGDPAGFTSLGQKIQQKVSGAESKALERRSSEAEDLYKQAKEEARAIQAEVPFSESEPGKRLIFELEREKGFTTQTEEGTKEFAAGKDKVQGIDKLLSALKPEVAGGKAELRGLERYAQTPTRKTYKDVEAVIEELRKLREVYKPGAEKTGYQALDAEYRKSLEDRLTNALYEWSEGYKKADQAYKQASMTLRPFKTQLMQRLLKKEKYNKDELIADTEQFANEFFSTRDTVRQLKAALRDDVFIKDIASDYFATLMSNKSPQAVREFVSNPNNQGWMQESGILDAANKFAQQTTKVESADRIKSLIKRGLIGGAAAGLGFKGVGTILGGL